MISTRAGAGTAAAVPGGPAEGDTAMKPPEDDMIRWVLATIAVVVCLASPARADEVLFVNGDRLTGAITQAVGGKLTIKSDTVGEVTVDLSKVKTFSTAQPVQLQSATRRC